MQNQTKRRETSKIDARITRRRRASRDVQKIAKKNALHVFGNLRRRLRRRVLADVRVRFAESASVSPYVSLSFFLMSSSFSSSSSSSSRGNDDDVVPLFVCDIYASADEQHRAFSPPITTTMMMIRLAQQHRTAAPRWIRRRRRVDRGMVGPKRTEFAERCRRFGRRATGEERRLQ
jgi:hypothetical protein